jgi:hypothetical protein
MILFCVNFYKQLAILLNLEIPMSRVTGNLIWECSHSIFHFRLWAWAAAALAWAMGEHSWARLEHTISKPEHVLKIHFSIRRSSFWLLEARLHLPRPVSQGGSYFLALTRIPSEPFLRSIFAGLVWHSCNIWVRTTIESSLAVMKVVATIHMVVENKG